MRFGISPKAAGLLEHPDAHFPQAVVLGHQPGQLDGRRQSGRPTAHDEDVDVHGVIAGLVGDDQSVLGEVGLVPDREDGGQSGLLRGTRIAVGREEYNPDRPIREPVTKQDNSILSMQLHVSDRAGQYHRARQVPVPPNGPVLPGRPIFIAVHSSVPHPPPEFP